ncbi:MAG: hypothetical protein NTZ68_04145 [Candidatus Dependentiae bacterium]|nr:hypothetical protein [Candidatus Dependentiae bacterium]
MKNITKLTFLSILSLLSANQALPYSFFYREVPVVVYHEPVIYRQVVYREPSAAEVIGVGIGCGIAALVGLNSHHRQIAEYTRMFQDLGYDRAQAKVYAKMAIETDGGFQAVVKSIGREKEANSQRDAQKEFEELKHQQNLEKMTYEHKLNSLDSNKVSFNKNSLMLFIAALLSVFAGLLFVGLALYKRKK